MLQNIKVDIIYYKIPTDFEMEFNLSGCCRMRLLTDKAPDRKTLVNQMTRAVSRSKVIIITGALFGEDNIIESCAKAIGRGLETADNKRFSIASEDKISIIKESLPLVSEDGIFGGCIVEQGPQTLILLTENKSVRKGIMQSLIHGYIREISEYEPEKPAAEPTEEVKEEKAEAPQESERVPSSLENGYTLLADEDEDYFTQEEGAEESGAEAAENTEEELPKDQILMEDDEDYLVNAIKQAQKDIEHSMEKGQELIFDVEKPKRRRDKRKIEVESTGSVNEGQDIFVGDYEDPEPERKAPFKINITIMIISIILLMAAVVLCYFLFVAPEMNNTTTAELISETLDTLFG